MSEPEPLRLHEEVLLLALHDEKGTVHFGAAFRQAAGGAILAELLLARRLGVDGEGRKARVTVLDPAPLGDPLLDECLETVVKEGKARKPALWVQKFANAGDLKRRAAERLVRRGVLKEEQDRVLLVFPRTVYPEADARPEREVVRRIRQAVVGSGAAVDPRTAVLIALCKYTNLLSKAVEKSVLKENKARLDRIVGGDVAGNATREAVQAMQAAIYAAAVVPTVTHSSHG